MANLYIANTTLQRALFNYRVPGNAKLMEQVIEPGAQIRVYKADAEQVDLDYIIEKHASYGLIAASEIDRSKDFIGLCYQFDKPIEVQKIARALRHNEAIKEKQGEALRKESALALNEKLQTESEGNLKSLTVEVQEELKRGASDVGMGEQVVTVQNSSERSNRPRRQKK